MLCGQLSRALRSGCQLFLLLRPRNPTLGAVERGLGVGKRWQNLRAPAPDLVCGCRGLVFDGPRLLRASASASQPARGFSATRSLLAMACCAKPNKEANGGAPKKPAADRQTEFMLEEHGWAFTRIAQLCVPKVARATGALRTSRPSPAPRGSDTPGS